MSTYQTRDDILIRLGFASYEAYLNSPLWASIRRRAFHAHGKKCKLCGKDTNVLHHKNYEWEVMSGKTVKGLVPLCKSCHYRIEFDIYGCKRTLDKVNNLLAWALSLGRDKERVFVKHSKRKFVHKTAGFVFYQDINGDVCSRKKRKSGKMKYKKIKPLIRSEQQRDRFERRKKIQEQNKLAQVESRKRTAPTGKPGSAPLSKFFPA